MSYDGGDGVENKVLFTGRCVVAPREVEKVGDSTNTRSEAARARFRARWLIRFSRMDLHSSAWQLSEPETEWLEFGIRGYVYGDGAREG